MGSITVLSEAIRRRKMGAVKPSYKANAQALIDWRTRRRMTQKQLAQVAGVSYTTISRIQTGKIESPHFSTLESLAEALGIDADEIIIYEDPSAA